MEKNNDNTLQHKKRFAVIGNAAINDANLSWAAKGLLLYLVSRPDGWNFYVPELCKHADCSRQQVTRLLAELERNKYLFRYRTVRPGTNKLCMVWVVEDGDDHAERIDKAIEEHAACKNLRTNENSMLVKHFDTKIASYNNTDSTVNTDKTDDPFTNTKVFEFPQGEQGVSKGICKTSLDAQQWDSVVQSWNQLAERWKLPKVMCMSAKRKRAFLARVKEAGSAEKFFEIVGTALKESPFLCGVKLVGGNGEYTWEKTDWRADFDFFLQESSFIKTMEGKYKDAAYRK